MTLPLQVVFGTGMLALCTIIHVASISAGIPFLAKAAARISKDSAMRTPALLVVGVVVIVVAHTLQIWLWAAVVAYLDAVGTFEASFYFALVTYTTLGYGDVVLGEGLRVFGAFASITGLLTFGLSTAFLIGIVARLMPVLSGQNGPKN